MSNGIERGYVSAHDRQPHKCTEAKHFNKMNYKYKFNIFGVFIVKILGYKQL